MNTPKNQCKRKPIYKCPHCTSGHGTSYQPSLCSLCHGVVFESPKGSFIFSNHKLEEGKWCGCNGNVIPTWRPHTEHKNSGWWDIEEVEYYV